MRFLHFCSMLKLWHYIINSIISWNSYKNGIFGRKSIDLDSKIFWNFSSLENIIQSQNRRISVKNTNFHNDWNTLFRVKGQISFEHVNSRVCDSKVFEFENFGFSPKNNVFWYCSKVRCMNRSFMVVKIWIVVYSWTFMIHMSTKLN